MPGGQPLRLGPFVGGLNTASDPTAIADAELVTSLNFELDLDGSLVSRPPLKELAGAGGFTERILLLGEGIFAGNHYIIGSNTNGVYHWLSGTWTLITNTFTASVAIQYADSVYLVPRPGSVNPGGRWNPTTGFVAVAAIPQGQAGIVHKERLFVVPGSISTTDTSRLKFSDAGDLDTWTGTNFIDVGQGDGTKLVDVTIFQDNLLLFKEQSTYVLAYDIRPSDAVLRKISLTIGADKQFNVVNYENQVYVFHRGSVYEILNYDFNRLNIKVPFIRDNTAPSAFSGEDVFLSLLGDRLVCRYYRKLYVFGLQTRTWSEWQAIENNLHYFGPILTIHPPTGDEYYAGCCLTANESLIQLFDKADASNKESILAAAATATAAADSVNTGYLVTSNADAADMAIGDIVQLYTAGAVLKESTIFRITSMNSAFGFTNLFFAPNAAVVPVTGDKLHKTPAIKCIARTKNFDMAISHQFKRLWWWGVDVTTNNLITGRATPVVISFNVSWSQLSSYAWNQLNTWDQPLSSPSVIETNSITNTGTSKRFAKFLQSLRYRQIHFEVELVTVGNTADGPARLFTMTVITESKQAVVEAVS